MIDSISVFCAALNSAAEAGEAKADRLRKAARIALRLWTNMDNSDGKI
jgi:hypothetical protein